jgi:hypothetical protein
MSEYPGEGAQLENTRDVTLPRVVTSLEILLADPDTSFPRPNQTLIYSKLKIVECSCSDYVFASKFL